MSSRTSTSRVPACPAVRALLAALVALPLVAAGCGGGPAQPDGVVVPDVVPDQVLPDVPPQLVPEAMPALGEEVMGRLKRLLERCIDVPDFRFET